MFRPFDASDRVIRQPSFLQDEVAMNLIHRIVDDANAVVLKSDDDAMIYARSVGRAWLWARGDLTEDERETRLQELVARLDGPPIPGVTGERQAAECFARRYASANRLRVEPDKALVAYECPEPKAPSGVAGSLRRAAPSDVRIVAAYRAGFSLDAQGVASDADSQLQASEAFIAAGGLYLWIADGEPVSMANIAHRSPRHARINAVYTPPPRRKRGYASALVASLSAIVREEGLTPMLYADVDNPDANGAYRKIGYVERGRVAELAFVPLD